MSDGLNIDELRKLVIDGKLKKALKLSKKMIACSSYQEGIEVYMIQYLAIVLMNQRKKFRDDIEFDIINRQDCSKTIIDELELCNFIYLSKKGLFKEPDLQKIAHAYNQSIMQMLEGIISYGSRHYKYSYKMFDGAANQNKQNSDMVLCWFYEYIINVYIHKSAIMGYGVNFNKILPYRIDKTSHLNRVNKIVRGKIFNIADDLLRYI